MDIEFNKLRHSCAHILASAILEIWSDAQLSIGPAKENGFFYDVETSSPISTKDFPQIEKKMQEIIKANIPFEKQVISREEAFQLAENGRLGALSQRGFPSTFKLDLLQQIPADEEISIYKMGDFWDLCAGPHMKNTGECQNFKILGVASCFYQGKEKNPQIQRISGTCFAKKEQLNSYLSQLEEAKLRDHRRLGKELGLFSIDEQIGQGLILWHPKGAILRDVLEQFLSEQLIQLGYQKVYTPHIAKLDLYRQSGHFPFYQESQFPPLLDKESLNEIDKEISAQEWIQHLEEGNQKGYLLRPMNCPHHMKIFSAEPRTYKTLPLRLFEFGTVYRWEKSGELGGMIRARGFTQDDGHIFCSQENLRSEILSCIDLTKSIFSILGISDYRVFLSLRGEDKEKYVGNSEIWEKSEMALKEAIQESGISCIAQEGEAAFYGPKIDFVIKDAIGRDWQLGTIQVDYNLPNRFNLTYIGTDNKKHEPVMIHRAPLGSLERFVGLLIEHFAGKFPLWLSPEQLRILPVSEKFMASAKTFASAFRKKGLRTKIDESNEKLGAKIRLATLERVPYTLVIGKREQESGIISARFRNGTQLENMPIDELINCLLQEANEKKLPDDFSILNP